MYLQIIHLKFLSIFFVKTNKYFLLKKGKIMSKVSIVNKALGYLGANRITSLSDGSFEAKCASNYYNDSLRSVLSECGWKFALDMVMLTKLDETPAWVEDGKENYFQLPPDLIEIFGIMDNSAIWERIGEKILTNAKSFGIKYVYFCDDTTKYPQYFIDAFACKLASDMCYDITNSNEKTMTLLELYKGEFLPIAKSKNAKAASRQQVEDSYWVNSVRGSIYG